MSAWLMQKILRILRRQSPDMEVAMGDTTTATPPATSGGPPPITLSKEDLAKLINEGVAAALGVALQPITDKIGETEKNLKTVADTVAGQKILGEDQVKALVATQAQTLADQTQKAAETKQAAEALKGKRSTFAAEHLKGVPSKYHADLGDDETKWAANADAIRTAFADDFKGAGLKIPDVGGNAGGAAVEGKPADGGSFLKMANPVGMPAPSPAPVATPAVTATK